MSVILTVLTVGLWFVLWLIYAVLDWLLTYRRTNWVCPICNLRI